MTGENALRRTEDVGGQELSYAEVKAIASGNPAMLTLAEADAELQRLVVLKKNHLDEQYVARRNVRDLPRTIAALSERLTQLTADAATAAAHAEGSIVVGNRACSREGAVGLLAGCLDALPRNVRETTRFPLGVFRGLRFGVVLHPQFAPDAYLDGAITRQSMLSREHHGPRAVLNAVERLANGYTSECERVRRDLGVAESQLRDYQARVGEPFHHDAVLSELTVLRDQLKACLSGKAPEPSPEPKLNTSDVAARIRALKAANSLEGAPTRSGKRTASAEEPVTARIRRRLEEALDDDAGTRTDKDN